MAVAKKQESHAENSSKKNFDCLCVVMVLSKQRVEQPEYDHKFNIEMRLFLDIFIPLRFFLKIQQRQISIKK
jgi:hypothetical protein